MKIRRFLSLVLCLCMVMTLFTGMVSTASADDNVITYTVKSGDYLFKICKNHGLDYYQCRNAIMLLNGFSSELQLNRLSVGQVVKLPASNAIAATVTASTTTTTTVSAGTSAYVTSTTTAASTTAVGLQYNDTIAYYLVPHTMLYGETIASVCNSIGTNYAGYAELIKSINGLASLNMVWAGKVIYFPTNTVPSSGTYYVVVAHKVLSGETTTSICSKYGISFMNNYTMVSGLNKTTNLNRIVVGQTLYVPALSTVVYSKAASTIVVPAATTAPASKGAYSITFADTLDGDPYAEIDSAVVTSADAGKTITVIPNALYGYAQETVTTQYANGSANVTMIGNTFIMPSADVVVTVKYAAGKAINSQVTKGGSVITTVDGAQVNSAIYGKTVYVVPTPKVGYEVETVTYSYWDALKGARTSKQISLKNGVYSFMMPDAAVTLSVSFKTATTYKIVTSDMISHGSLSYKIDGYSVSRSSAGKTVYVTAAPQEGYVLSKVTVTDSGKGVVDVIMDGTNGASFVMPAKAVTVNATFVKAQYYGIGTELTVDGKLNSAGGWVQYTVNGQAVGRAREGDEVKIVSYSNGGYTQDMNDTAVRLASNNAKVTDLVKETNTFIMPGADVIVTIDFAPGAHSISLASVSNGSITTAVNENKTTNAQAGEIVEIIPNPNTNYTVDDSNIHVTYISKSASEVYTNHDVNKIKVCTDLATTKSELDTDKAALKADPETKTNRIIKFEDATTGTVRYFFVMPEWNVTASVGFKLAETKSISLGGVDIYTKYNSTEKTANLSVNTFDLSKIAEIKYVVDGVAVDNCTPGHKVVLDTHLKAGLSIKTVKVNGNEIKAESGVYSFVMPNKEVVIEFVLQMESFDIGRSSAGEIKVTKLTRDAAITPVAISASDFQAYNGDTVEFTVKPNAGYVIDSVSVLTGDLEEIDVELTNTTGTVNTYTFTMPAQPVAIKATYAKTTYPLTKKLPITNGSFTLTVGEEAGVTEASKGSTVKVVVSPMEGYKVKEVKANCGVTVTPVESSDKSYWYFTMPGEAVEVEVTFEAATYKVSAKAFPTEIGTIDINGKTTDSITDAVYEAKFGDAITVKVTAANPTKADLHKGDDGKPDEVFYNGIRLYTTDSSSPYTFTFTMPASDVLVKAGFEAEKYNITKNNADEVKYPGLPDNAAFGTTVSFKAETIDARGTVAAIKVEAGGTPIDTVYDKASGNWSFTMPDKDVKVSATEIRYSATVSTSGAGKSSLTIDSSTHEACVNQEAGKTVYIVLEPNDGQKLSKIVIRDLSGNDITDSITLTASGTNYEFAMPKQSITIEVYYVWYAAYSVDVAGFDPDQVHWANVNGQNVPNYGAVIGVAAGDTVNINVNVKDGLKLDDSTLTITPTVSEKVTNNGTVYTISFKMPAENVTVTGITTKNKDTDTLYSAYWGTVTNGRIDFTTATGSVDELNNVVKAGDTVTVVLHPNDGYESVEPTILDADWRPLDSSVTFTKVNDNTYTFNMPERSVRISESFARVNAAKVIVTGLFDTKTEAEYLDVQGYKTFTTDGEVEINYNADVIVKLVIRDPLKLSDTIANIKTALETANGITISEAKLDQTNANWAYIFKFKMPATDVDIDFTTLGLTVINKTPSDYLYNAYLSSGGRADFGSGPDVAAKFAAGATVTITYSGTPTRVIVRDSLSIVLYDSGDSSAPNAITYTPGSGTDTFTMPNTSVSVEMWY